MDCIVCGCKASVAIEKMGMVVTFCHGHSEYQSNKVFAECIVR